MQIVVNITSCNGCRHRDHSGAYTPGGAKPICGHNCSVDFAPGARTAKKSGNKDDRWNWQHRVLKNPDYQIPEWCPLKHGREY